LPRCVGCVACLLSTEMISRRTVSGRATATSRSRLWGRRGVTWLHRCSQIGDRHDTRPSRRRYGISGRGGLLKEHAADHLLGQRNQPQGLPRGGQESEVRKQLYPFLSIFGSKVIDRHGSRPAPLYPERRAASGHVRSPAFGGSQKMAVQFFTFHVPDHASATLGTARAASANAMSSIRRRSASGFTPGRSESPRSPGKTASILPSQSRLSCGPRLDSSPER